MRKEREYTAGQHNDSRPSSAVAEHLPQTFLLIGSQDGRGLQVHVDVGVHRVIPEVVLGQERILQLNAALLELLDHLLMTTAIKRIERNLIDFIQKTAHTHLPYLERHRLRLLFFLLLLIHLFVETEDVFWHLGFRSLPVRRLRGGWTTVALLRL